MLSEPIAHQASIAVSVYARLLVVQQSTRVRRLLIYGIIRTNVGIELGQFIFLRRGLLRILHKKFPLKFPITIALNAVAWFTRSAKIIPTTTRIVPSSPAPPVSIISLNKLIKIFAAIYILLRNNSTPPAPARLSCLICNRKLWTQAKHAPKPIEP